MKLGLLQCDEVLPEFLHIIGDFPDMIGGMMGGHRDDLELVVYRVYEGTFPASVDDCDFFIGGGARQSVFENEDWIHQFEDFVRELHACEKKFVGICFSHQMIAQALGGKVERSSRDWGVGIKAMKISGTKPWMKPPLTDCHTLFSHQDQVTRLPESAELLGGNDHCPHGLYTVGDHFLSIQAHPEYSADYVRALTEIRRGIIPEPIREAGLTSLEQPHHQHELAQWIQNFLKAAE